MYRVDVLNRLRGQVRNLLLAVEAQTGLEVEFESLSDSSVVASYRFTPPTAIPVLTSDLKSASISVYLEQEKRDGNQLVPLWSQGRESFQWQGISFYRQILYSH